MSAGDCLLSLCVVFPRGVFGRPMPPSEIIDFVTLRAAQSSGPPGLLLGHGEGEAGDIDGMVVDRLDAVTFESGANLSFGELGEHIDQVCVRCGVIFEEQRRRACALRLDQRPAAADLLEDEPVIGEAQSVLDFLLLVAQELDPFGTRTAHFGRLGGAAALATVGARLACDSSGRAVDCRTVAGCAVGRRTVGCVSRRVAGETELDLDEVIAQATMELLVAAGSVEVIGCEAALQHVHRRQARHLEEKTCKKKPSA